MPELLGLGLPVWAIIIVLLLTNQHFTRTLNKTLSLLGIVSAKSTESEIDERRYQRSRESEMFGVLKSIIDNSQQESKDRDKILSELTATLQKNTDALSRQIDMIRLLAYNASTVDEKLDGIYNHIQTRRLKYEEKD